MTGPSRERSGCLRWRHDCSHCEAQLRATRSPSSASACSSVPPEEAEKAVSEALEVGYRHIDTAAIYRNEEGVGAALEKSGIARDELFITTKLWNDRQAGDEPHAAIRESLDKLRLDYVDLYLTHWPVPQQDTYSNAWQEAHRDPRRPDCRARSACRPTCPSTSTASSPTRASYRPSTRSSCTPPTSSRTCSTGPRKNGTRIESWGPLGQGKYPLFENPAVQAAAEAHDRSPAQVVIRWHLQRGIDRVPEVGEPFAHRAESFDVFDFELTAAEVDAITAIDPQDGSGRVGGHPLESR